MGIKEDTLKQINELRVPGDMKKMAWDWYIFGFNDGVKNIKIDNNFLIKIDSEAMQMCMSKKWGGEDKKLSDIGFLEFRKRLYKKYYIEEGEDSPKN